MRQRRLPGKALPVLDPTQKGEHECSVKRPCGRVNGGGKDAPRTRDAGGSQRRKVGLSDGEEHQKEEGEDGKRPQEIEDAPETADGLEAEIGREEKEGRKQQVGGERIVKAEIGREEKEGRKQQVGGERIVKDALHHELLFKQRDIGGEEEEDRQERTYHRSRGTAEGALHERKQGEPALCEQHRRKDGRALGGKQQECRKEQVVPGVRSELCGHQDEL